MSKQFLIHLNRIVSISNVGQNNVGRQGTQVQIISSLWASLHAHISSIAFALLTMPSTYVFMRAPCHQK